ncbi:MAG TPA: NUDIX hydrolase [Egibacteraceae bacterium]|nr:NUDIX hydrolase [Egibacteraceae bacterium]
MGWYEVESSDVRYDGVLSRIRIDRVQMPEGGVADREVAEHASAVAIVPVDDEAHVVLVRQYRHPVGAYLLEIPAGLLDVDGEGFEAAARRELAEETGLEAGQLDEIGMIYNSAGWTDESTRLYLARGLTPAAAPDGYVAEHEEADMEIVRLPLGEAADMAVDGVICDAKTVAGLLIARERLRRDGLTL